MPSLDVEEDDGYTDSYEDEEEVEQHPGKLQPHPIILGPQGPIGIYKLSDEVMNFWIGHSDFQLTATILHLIEDTAGVESLEVFTPYRMRISVGKMFQPRNVMGSIGESINSHFYCGSGNGR